MRKFFRCDAFFLSVFIRVHPWLKVIRLIARFPFDVATDTGSLLGRNRLSGEQRIKGGAEIVAGDGRGFTGTTVVELPPVNEFVLVIKKENIRGAGGVVGFGHGLGFVIEIGKNIIGRPRFFLHFLGTVIGITPGIVAADGDDGHALALIIAGEFRQPHAQMLHIGTMIADKQNDERTCVIEMGERDDLAVRVRQGKIRRAGAERQHG